MSPGSFSAIFTISRQIFTDSDMEKAGKGKEREKVFYVTIFESVGFVLSFLGNFCPFVVFKNTTIEIEKKRKGNTQ